MAATISATMSERAAKAKAEQLVNLTLQIKTLENEKANIEDELRGYVNDTGQRDIGPILAYTRAAPVSLAYNGRPAKEVDAVLIEMIDPDYVQKKLDVKAIAESYSTDTEMTRLLVKYKVLPQPGEEKIYFKHV